MRKCRFCAKEIQDASRVCEHCGRELAPAAAPAAPLTPPSLPELARPGSQFASGFLVAVAVIGAAFGVLSLSNATIGVGLLCGACLLGILARIQQASVHHADLRKWLSQRPSV